MSENKEGEDVVRKGNDWEVVALTESAYLASPGPHKDFQDVNRISSSGDDNVETTDVMFMSGHFGVTPNLHEKLPLEPDYKEIYHEKNYDDDVPQLTMQQGSKSELDNDENLRIDQLTSKESLDDAVSPGSNVQKHIEEDKSNEQRDLSCELWWKKQATSIYGHVKNANPYWSIVVAAAVMGLVIIGHRWQREKPPVFQLKSQLIIEKEGFSHSQFH